MHSKKQRHKADDVLEHLRKPHGIAIAVVILGVAGWAVWTFWVW